MTAATVAGPGASAVAVALRLAARNVLLLRRMPSALVPSILFPIFIVVSFSGAFGGITRLGQFPVENMIDWILPMAVIQGAAFSGVNVGLGMIRDFEDGFFDRLLVAPISRVALIAGPMLGAVVRALIPVATVLVAGTIGGAGIEDPVLGLGALVLASLGAAAASAGWAIGLALRFKDMRAAPLMQVGLFVGIFLSTAQVPLDVMTGWLRVVARWNPTTYVLELARQGFVDGVSWADTWPGLACLAGAVLVLGTFAVRGLRAVEP